MAGFAQFEFKVFKLSQTHFNYLHISMDPDQLESSNVVCSLITAMQWFAKLICGEGYHFKCIKMHLNIIDAYHMKMINHCS